MIRLGALLTALALSAIMACDDRRSQPPVTSSKPSDPAKLAPAKIDQELSAAVRRVALNCQFSKSREHLRHCPDGEAEAFARLVARRSQISGDPALVETLSGLLSEPDPRMVAAAGQLLANSTRRIEKNLDEQPPGALCFSRQSAQRLLQLLPNLPAPVAKDTVVATVYGATFNGLVDQTIAALASVQDRPVRRTGYSHVMRYGRLAVFPQIRQLAKSTNPQDLRTALSAPQNMQNYSNHELSTVCEWAKRFVIDQDVETAATAAMLLVHPCGGPFIDLVLDEGKRRLIKGDFKRPMIQVFRNICFRHAQPLTPRGATHEQCARTYIFLEKVVNDRATSPEVRGLALDAIARQRRNDESLELCRKYRRHPLEPIKRQANKCVTSLTELQRVLK